MTDHHEDNRFSRDETLPEDQDVHSAAEALLKLTMPELWQILRELTVINSTIRSAGDEAKFHLEAKSEELKNILIKATSQMAEAREEALCSIQTQAASLSIDLGKSKDEFVNRAIMDIEQASMRSIEGAAGEVRGRTAEAVDSHLKTVNATFKAVVDELTHTTWRGLLLWAGKLIAVIVLATAVNQLIAPAFNSLYPRSRALMLEAAEYEYVLAHADSTTLQHIGGVLETRKGK
jgi:hypothetical protein